MDADSAQTTPADAGVFEDFENFKVNFRQLALRLVELHGPPAGHPAWPFTAPGPVSPEECSARGALALDHSLRHDIGTTPTAPRCAFADDKCKALGAAQVVLALLWAPGDEHAAEPARRLHKAFSKADRAMANLAAKIAAYNETRARRHEPASESPPSAIPCTTLGHAQFCAPLGRLSVLVEQWRKSLALVDAFSLAPQIPKHVRGKDRLGLLKSLEATLVAHGWTRGEIVAVLDDNDGGGPRARNDRLRKRLAHRRNLA